MQAVSVQTQKKATDTKAPTNAVSSDQKDALVSELDRLCRMITSFARALKK